MYSMAPRQVNFVVIKAFEALQSEVRGVFRDRLKRISMRSCFALFENATSHHNEKGKRVAGYPL